MVSTGAVAQGTAALVVDSRCLLGECPQWCAADGTLWWTDIESTRLWRLHVPTATTHSWKLPDRLGSFAFTASGKLLLGLSKGLYLADVPDDETSEPLPVTLLEPVDAQLEAVRINDGRVDRSGNFLFGTLNEDPQRAPVGSFYQYSWTHGLRRLPLGGVAIPNSLCLAPDGNTLYFCDGCSGRIMQCAYDADAATVADVREFIRVPTPGAPDGAAVDRAGNVWSAQWGLGRVACYAPDGELQHLVEVPASHVSCPVFAGDALDRMFITTASVELDAAQRDAEPLAGGLFEVQVPGVRGLPEPVFNDR